jgi:hypothetical protein
MPEVQEAARAISQKIVLCRYFERSRLISTAPPRLTPAAQASRVAPRAMRCATPVPRDHAGWKNADHGRPWHCQRRPIHASKNVCVSPPNVYLLDAQPKNSFSSRRGQGGIDFYRGRIQFIWGMSEKFGPCPLSPSYAQIPIHARFLQPRR